MQKEATNLMVKHMDFHELRELRTIFQSLDHTNSGTITAAELKTAMTKVGIKPGAEEITKIIENIDYLGNGEINYTEFLAATFHMKHRVTE
jgi:Ca2+-binding EF-hand superfamily protein